MDSAIAAFASVAYVCLQMTGDVGAGDTYTFWAGAWDPHDLNRLCTAGGNGIQVGCLSRLFSLHFIWHELDKHEYHVSTATLQTHLQ